MGVLVERRGRAVCHSERSEEPPGRSRITLIRLRDARILERSFASLRMTIHDLKFVSAVRAEDEFKLKKHGIGIATGQEKRVIDEVVIVLQTNL